MDENFIKAKRKKKIGIYLLCWPLIIFCIWFFVSFVFWSINKSNLGGESIELIHHRFNWVLGLLTFLYVFALPVGIALTVDANSDLKKMAKDSSVH